MDGILAMLMVAVVVEMFRLESRLGKLEQKITIICNILRLQGNQNEGRR